MYGPGVCVVRPQCTARASHKYSVAIITKYFTGSARVCICIASVVGRDLAGTNEGLLNHIIVTSGPGPRVNTRDGHVRFDNISRNCHFIVSDQC